MKMKFNKSQAGIATLATAVILLLVSTILVFAVAKAVTNDQRSVGDELRTKEAYEAAKGALEYGLAQLLVGNSVLNAWSGNSVGDTTTPVTQPGPVTMATGNSYGLTVTYFRLTDYDPTDSKEKPIYRVTATATPTAGDTQVTRTVSTIVLRANLLNTSLTSAGPILVQGNMIDTKGTAEVVPGDNGVAISSLTEGASIDTGSMETHGGTTTGPAAGSGTYDLSLAMFGIEDDAELDSVMKTLSEISPSTVHYVEGDYTLGNLPASFTSDDSLLSLNITDPNNQHIVYFPRYKSDGTPNTTCPKLNGNPNIVGLVYIAIPDCTDQGWGGCNIYGTVAFSGNINDLNSNCQFIGVDLNIGEESEDSPTTVLSPVPGTWKDF